MTKPLFVIGAQSRVGRLLRAVWTGGPVVWCARSGPVDVTWDVEQGAAALAALMDGSGSVLCLAGATPGAQSFDLNAEIGRAVVEAAAQAGVPRVLLASSMAVYSGGAAARKETDFCAPRGAYGQSKLAMEAACLGYPDVHVIALRLSNVVGADMLFRNISAGRLIEIDRFSDGRTPARSYIDPVRLARVVERLANAPDVPEIVNVALAPAVEMGALADAAGVVWRPRPAPEAALPCAEMDVSRLAGLIDLPAASAETLVAGWRSARCDA